MTITDFLLARIAEDEAAARAAAESASPAMFPDPSIPGPVWEAHDGMVAGPPDGDGFVTSLWDDEGSKWLRMHPDAAQHIARHDPARVLAECAAKRAIIQKCLEWPKSRDGWDKFPLYAAGNDVLFALAAVYKDHPDYQQEWGMG